MDTESKIAPTAKPPSPIEATAVGTLPNVSPYRWFILIGLITAAMMEVLDTTIVNVSLPQMAGNLDATSDEIAWVATGYILSNVIVLPMTAWLSSRFGRKRYLAGSIILFIVASFLCGASHSLAELILWRIVQGAGGAALLSTAQAAVLEVFPREQQGIVQALFILGIIVSPTVGPTIGGYITDNFTWPWIFFVNVPIGLISLSLVLTFLEDSKFQKRVESIDWAGISLLIIGLGSLQYVLEEGERNDWFESALIVKLTILATVAIAILIIWEISPANKHPVVDLRILKNRGLTGSLLLFLVLGFGLYGAIFIFPMFTQNILGLSPTATGLVLFPGGIATAIAAVICGAVLNGRKPLVGVRPLILFGMALFILSMWELGHLTTASGEPETRTALIIRGISLGFLFTPLNLAAFSALKGAEIAQGSGLINLTRQLGGSFGIAILNTYVTNMAKFHRVNLVQNLSIDSQPLQERLAQVSRILIAHGDSPTMAAAAAYRMVDRTVQAQSYTMAYNDGFLLILVSFVFAAPAVFLLSKTRKPNAAPAGGH